MKTADLTAEMARSLSEVEYRWPTRIPAAFEQKMIAGDRTDPIARQVLPSIEELKDRDGYSDDPVGDRAAENGEGLLVKYDGRALLLMSALCAVHCRYCFRREYRRSTPPVNASSRKKALERLGAMMDVKEVILSGGDPLMLPNGKIAEVLTAIDTMAHIERIRIHTRMVTAVPERIDPPLLAALKTTRKPLIVVTHVNHAAELDEATASTLSKIRETGALLLNQSVLLRGVNDSIEALVALSEKLIGQGVVPYYLHQLDRVTGAAHFEVPIAEGRSLIDALRKRCPGYMVPRYVIEVPGAASKSAIL